MNGDKHIRDELLIYGSPKIDEPEIQEVVDCLRSGWLSTGPRVARFENEFRKYIGAEYAIALNSCSAGLHLALIVAGIGPGDEVITTPMTFAATANNIVHVGAQPVFVDIEPDTMNIDPNLIEEQITQKTMAIIPVHLAGRPCDMESIMEIAQAHDLLVIEDAAHALESVYKGAKIGTIGDLTAFSFYVTKNLVTGEGGMVTTQREEWAEAIQILALHGLSKGAWQRFSGNGFRHYQVLFPGFKYNMMDIQAALGIHQIRRVEEYWKIRALIWERYNREFSNQPVFTPTPIESNTKHAYHLYTLLLDLEHLTITRDQFQQALYEEGIGTGIHFIALHLHPYYSKHYHYKLGDFPNAEFISERTISLPLSAKLTEKDVDDVIAAVKKILNRHVKKKIFNIPKRKISVKL
ncbi:MAG: DegT/DnrJ/EryC1/StrS family aminotransferase [bacterium]